MHHIWVTEALNSPKKGPNLGLIITTLIIVNLTIYRNLLVAIKTFLKKYMHSCEGAHSAQHCRGKLGLLGSDLGIGNEGSDVT